MELKQKAMTLVAAAKELQVTDQTSMEMANDFVIKTRTGKKGVVGFFKDMKQNAHTAWKTICNKEKGITDVFDQADAIASKKVIVYRNEERRKAEEAQRKADQERLNREQKERDKLLKQAEKAEAKGNTEKAELLADQAAEVHEPAAVAEPAVKKTEVSGAGTVSGIEDWDVQILSTMAVIQAVAAGDLPEHVVSVSVPQVKKYAKDNKIKHYSRNGLRIERTERLSAKASFNRG